MKYFCTCQSWSLEHCNRLYDNPLIFWYEKSAAYACFCESVNMCDSIIHKSKIWWKYSIYLFPVLQHDYIKES